MKARTARFVSLLLLLTSVPAGLAFDKKLNELGAKTRAEKFLVASLRKNGEANLGLLPEGERNIRSAFLKEILFDLAESEIPSRTIKIYGAVVEGHLTVQGEREASVSRAVVLQACKFTGPVMLHSARFDQGLTFARSSFQRGLFLQRIHVKGDVLLSKIGPASEGEDIVVMLDGAHIEGQLTMQSMMASSIQAQRLTAQSVRLDLTPGTNLKKVDLSQLEAESLTIADYHITSTSPLHELWLNEASIKKTLRVSHVILDDLLAPGLIVDGRTDLDDGVGIRDSVDLSRANLGTFVWGIVYCASGNPQSDQICWPSKISIGATSFRSISIRTYLFPDPQADTPPTWDTEDKTLQFLRQATFSESAYTSYEQWLRNRGLIPEADDVFRAMHAHKRTATWRASHGFLGWIGAVAFIAIDLLQKALLGYGRSALPPLLWSLGFVIVGGFVFRDEKRMEVVGEHPPKFSAVWYSLELFLPVVDLGVAKSWRPRSASLLAYGRIHQLAGWILIPVALAAITGVFK